MNVFKDAQESKVVRLMIFLCGYGLFVCSTAGFVITYAFSLFCSAELQRAMQYVE